MESEEQPEEGKKQCKNCLQFISAAIFELHEPRCKRHTTLCQVCKEPVAKEELEKHMQDEHAPVACQDCGKEFLREEIDHHRDNTCPEFKIDCKYCELEIPRKDYSEHVDGCGGRTDICEQCSQRVRLKDMSEHQQNKCGKTQVISAPAPQPYQGFDQGFDQGFYSPLSGALLSSRDGPAFLPLPFDASSQSSRFMHPFVPLPAQPVVSHAQQQQQQPKPPESHATGDSLRVDTQWLASVAGACGEESLDQVLAQNMMIEDYRRQSPPTHFPPSYNGHSVAGRDVERDADLAQQLQQDELDRQSHFVPSNDIGYNAGASTAQSSSDWDPNVDQAALVNKDAELAKQLHDQDLAYSERTTHNTDSKMDWGTGVDPTTTDAELARRLHDRDEAYAKSQKRDKELAEHLQEEERQANLRSRGSINDHSVYEPTTLEGYGRRPLHGPAVPDVYGGSEHESVTFDDSIFARELQQRQEEERISAMGGAPRLEGEASVMTGYDMGVLDNEQPRAKTPPHHQPELQSTENEEKIPCEFCNVLYPFGEIYEHQRSCQLQGAPTRYVHFHAILSPVDRDGPSFFRPQVVAATRSVEEMYSTGKREVEPSLEAHRYLPPTEEEQRHYPSSTEGVIQSSRAGEAQSPAIERPSRGGQQYYDMPSIERFSSSSRASEAQSNQPPVGKGPSRGGQKYDLSSIESFPSSRPKVGEQEHPGRQKYSPSTDNGSSSTREEQKYPSGRFPSSSRVKEELKSSPTSRDYPSFNEDGFSREKRRYKPSSNGTLSSSSRATEERGYGHIPSSEGVASSSAQNYMSPYGKEARREGRREYSPPVSKLPLASSREVMNLTPHRERGEASVLVTDDLMKQISRSSNQVPIVPRPLSRPPVKPMRQEESEDKGPCEVCGKLFTIGELVKHEAICAYQQSRKSEIAPSVKHAPVVSKSLSGGRTSGRGNSRKELSVEGYKVGGAGHYGKPVHSSQSPPRSVGHTSLNSRQPTRQTQQPRYGAKETSGSQHYDATAKAHARSQYGKHTGPPTAYAPRGTGNGFVKAKSPPAGSTAEWGVKGTKMATKDSPHRSRGNTGPRKREHPTYSSGSQDGD